MVLLSTVITVACRPAGLVQGPWTGWTDDVTSALRSGLPGIALLEGGVRYLDQEGCAPIVAAGGTCFGAHPASPYGMFDFGDPDGAPPQTVLDYQLDDHEAIVFVGHAPPPSRYFSFNHHQFRKALPDGTDEITFATLAPSMNLLGWSTAHSPLHEGLRTIAEVPFGDYTAVIFTANQETAGRIETALVPILERAGHSADAINVHRMAYADADDVAALVAAGRSGEDVFTLSMGYGPAADTFNAVLRVAAPVDHDDPYLDTRRIPAAVFKATLDDPPGYDPFPWPTFPPDGQTGEAQARRLADAQRDVLDALIATLVPPQLQTLELESPRRAQRSGAHCINLLDRCGANNDDARYHRTLNRMALPDADAPASVFVVGVNHTRVAELDPSAPQVTYTSLTLNNYSRGFGVVTLLDRELEGSLEFWLDPGDLPADFPLGATELDAIYVVQFARDCGAFGWAQRFGRTNPYCVEFDDGVLGVCPYDKLWFTERVYLNETSGTAPVATSVHPPLTLAVGPEISWTDAGSGAGVGGAWLLSTPPDPPPEQGAWCRSDGP